MVKGTSKYAASIEELTTDDYFKLAEHVVQGFYNRGKLPSFQIEDARSDVILRLIEALPKFDPSRGSLGNFLYNVAKYATKTFIRTEMGTASIEENVSRPARDPRSVIKGKRELVWDSFEPPTMPDEQADINRTLKKRIAYRKNAIVGRANSQRLKVRGTHLYLDNIPEGISRPRCRWVPNSLKELGSVASRRNNMPDPRCVGFPWSNK